MRLWLVRPELMCKQHLSGEHLECHMFYGSMEGERTLNGFYEARIFFGPRFLKQRHSEIRRYLPGHKTPMEMNKTITHLASRINGRLRYFYPDRLPTEEDIKQSRLTLITRCRTCRKKHLRAKREGRPYRYSLDHGFVLRHGRHGTPEG